MLCKTYRKNKETNHRGAPRPCGFFIFPTVVLLYIWATILVIRMVALAARMVSRYHPNHPSLSPRPGEGGPISSPLKGKTDEKLTKQKDSQQMPQTNWTN